MNKQKPHLDSGFSLIEVLAAILIVAFFTTVAMQMMVISAAFKAKAKEYTTATNLIEEDIESVRNLAAQYQFPTVASPVPTVGATTIVLSTGNGLQNNDKIQFSGSSNVYTIASPSSIPFPSTTTTILITPGIISPAPALNTRVASNTVCSGTRALPTPVDQKGLANDLRMVTQGSSYIDNRESPPPITVSEGGSDVIYKPVVGANPYTIPDTNKKLWLMRNDTNLNTPPYNILQVRYLVVKDNNGSPSSQNIVAKLSSEVIPNASLQCIQ